MLLSSHAIFPSGYRWGSLLASLQKGYRFYLICFIRRTLSFHIFTPVLKKLIRLSANYSPYSLGKSDIHTQIHSIFVREQRHSHTPTVHIRYKKKHIHTQIQSIFLREQPHSHTTTVQIRYKASTFTQKIQSMIIRKQRNTHTTTVHIP